MDRKIIFKNGIWILLVAAGLVGGYFMASSYIPGNTAVNEVKSDGAGNPALPENFKYDMAKLKQYDPRQLLYGEETKIKTGLKEPFGLTVNKKDGRVLVVSTEGMLVCDGAIAGKVAALPVRLEGPGSVSFGFAGELLLAGRDSVNIVSGTIIGFGKKGKGVGEFKYITSVKANAKYIFTADAGNRRVCKFDLKGKYLGQIGRKDKAAGKNFVIPSPHMDMDFDSKGNLWVANAGLLQLEKYSPEGVFVSSWGKHGINIDEFIGCCNPVNFVIDGGDNFITAEKGVLRIKKYDKTGKFLGVVAPPGTFNEKNTSIPLAVDSKNRVYALDTIEKTVRVFSEKGY